MDKLTLVKYAAESKLLQNYAKKLCNYRDIHNDLFQEFLLFLMEQPESKLLDKFHQIRFIHYCHIKLNGMNLDRIKANTLTNTRNPLVERSNNVDISDIELEDKCYNSEIEYIRTLINENNCVTLQERNLKNLARKENKTFRQIYYRNKKEIELIKKIYESI